MHIGFVNFNTDEKKRVAKMMQTLKEQEAVEELGIGRVRDHFSNTLFPGTSTLQHHAKYFVVLPWIYYNAITGEKGFKNRQEVNRYIREQEILLTISLDEGNPGRTGITGKEKLAAAKTDYTQYVKYNPTYIYSSGMCKYGIVANTNIEKLILDLNRAHNDELTEENEQKIDCSEFIATCGENYDLGPKKPLSLDLTKKESEFIKDKIMALEGDPMLKQLIIWQEKQDPKYEMTDYFEAGKFVVKHPQEKLYRHSVIFSKLIHILDWRYNYVYYNSFHAMDPNAGYEEKAKKCDKEYEDLRGKFIDTYDQERVGEMLAYIGTIDHYLTEFCRECYDAILENTPERKKELDGLIRKREERVKTRKRSKIGNPAYKGKDRIAPQPIEYRWTTVKEIVTEIAKAQFKE